MKRLLKWVSFTVPALALLIGASAGTARAPGGKATPLGPRTLVTEKAPIRAFAQDETTISWVGRTYQVHVRSLTNRASAVVGNAGPAVTGYHWSPVLALGGSDALWTTFPSGGNSLESGLMTAGPWDARATAVDLASDPQSPTGGTFFTGLAGDGPTLVYGTTWEKCDDPGGSDCRRLDAIGGVAFVTGQYGSSLIPDIPAPVMLAFTAHDPQSSKSISQGLIAVAPAETPVLTDLGNVPRVAENGPVQVFRTLFGQTNLVSSVTPRGWVRAIALSFQQLAVLVARTDGTKAIERYNAESGELIGTTAVPRGAASALSISNARVVYRVGRGIYVLSTSRPKLAWTAKGTPIGLSIKGQRIAWAENVKGVGRVQALTLDLK